MKAMVCSSDTDINFDIVTGVLQEDTLASDMFIICQDYILQTSINLIKDNGFTLKKTSKRHMTSHRNNDRHRLCKLSWTCQKYTCQSWIPAT